MEALQEIMQMADSVFNHAVEDWKRQGGSTLGYTYDFVPVEIIHAAGILPYRIKARGAGQPTVVDGLMAPNTCSFCRGWLELAMKGEYRFLDGLVYSNACDTMRRAVDNWRLKLGAGFTHFLSVPHKSHDKAVEWYTEELSQLKSALERFSGASISDQALQDSIEVCNRRRDLLREVYELGKRDNPPLSGAQMTAIAVLAHSMPLNECDKLLNGVLEKTDALEGSEDYRPRLMTVANLDDSRYTEIIERAGAQVVTDASSFGTMSCWEPLESTGKPLDDIARYYLNDVSPNRMGREAKLRDYVTDMVSAFRVDGVIFERLRYCNTWAGAAVSLEKDLQKLDIPLLILDREYHCSGSGEGQIATRVQAFLEMLL